MIRVVASVIWRNDTLLLCRRPAHKRHGGLWEFPGGKMENGEDCLATARRELSEELGVEVLGVKGALFSRRDLGSEFVIEFIPVEIDGNPVCHEHSELAWVREADLLNYELAPSDKEFAQHLSQLRRS